MEPLIPGGLAAILGEWLGGSGGGWQDSGGLWPGIKLIEACARVLGALRCGDVRELGRLTTSAFEGPLQALVPEASNAYTERLIAAARAGFGEQFWGFWMMGGMSGGGMGFLFDPAVRARAEAQLLELMLREKRALEQGMSFSMEPVVYRTAINEVGTMGRLHAAGELALSGEHPLLPQRRLQRAAPASISALRCRPCCNSTASTASSTSSCAQRCATGASA